MLQLTFVGTGVSCAVPVIGHIDRGCACDDARRRPHGPNRRNNVSLLLTIVPDDDDTVTRQQQQQQQQCSRGSDEAARTACNKRRPMHVLIDCGKTFRDAYLRVLARHKVRAVDALLLTHGHADAMLCCDELCELHDALRCPSSSCDGDDDDVNDDDQDDSDASSSSSSLLHVPLYIPTYLSEATLREVQHILPLLARRSRYAPSSSATASPSDMQRSGDDNAKATTRRQRTALEWHVLPDDTPTRFYIDALRDVTTTTAASEQSAHTDGQGFAMYALPVEHGKGYMCLGFVFGRGVALRSSNSNNSSSTGSCVVYLSDVSALPPAAEAFLRDLVKIDVLIVDMLAERGERSPTHYCMDDVVQLLRRVTPVRTYCVGMFCSVAHDSGNAAWRDELAAERARLRDVLAQHSAGSGKDSNDDDDTTMAARRFLQQVQSVELAYDGMQLQLPL